MELNDEQDISKISADVKYLDKPVAPEGFSTLALPLLINRDCTTIIFNGQTYQVVPEGDPEDVDDESDDQPDEEDSQYVKGYTIGYQLGAEFGQRFAQEKAESQTSTVFNLPDSTQARIEGCIESFNSFFRNS